MAGYANSPERYVVSRPVDPFDFARIDNKRNLESFDLTTLQPGERVSFSASYQDDRMVGSSAQAVRNRTAHLPVSQSDPLDLPSVPKTAPKADDKFKMGVTRERAQELMWALFGCDDEDLAAEMRSSLAAVCNAQLITPLQLLEFAQQTQRFIDMQRQHPDLKNRSLRTRALTAIIEVSGNPGLKSAAEVLADGRKVDWTRLTLALGDGTLTGLAAMGGLGTGAAATYMVGASAAAHVSGFKLAASTGAKTKCGALALGAGVGTMALAGATAFGDLVSWAYWQNYVQAYRDIWDNEIGRDTYLFHRLKAHGVLPGAVAKPCNHANLAFTSPNARMANYLAGKRSN